MYEPYIELSEFSAYVIRTAARVLIGIVSIITFASLVKFVVPKITPEPIVITKIQMVEGSQPISLPNDKVLMQCGVTGMDWLQMCDDKHRYTLKITGMACNIPSEELGEPTKVSARTWDTKFNCR